MVKKIIIPIVLILIAIVAVFLLGKVLSPLTGENPGDGLPKIEIDPNVPDITLPLSNTPKDVAWALFQKYLAYNKDQDLDGVRGVVYKVAPVCEDLKTTIDCKARMGLAYQYGSALKKADFKNVWTDEKQIILSTDFTINEDASTINRSRGIIFFVRDGENLKMLSFSPFKGASASKGAASRTELVDRLTRYTEDKDEDGVADYIEECIPAETKDTCVPTNPRVRDTDGNGFWDGIQALMR